MKVSSESLFETKDSSSMVRDVDIRESRGGSDQRAARPDR